MTVTLFHHPGAGEGEWPADRLLGALRDAGFDPAYASLDEDGWERNLAETDELVIAAGGDGTVASIATRLGGRPVRLAILPTGSGNNIARSLGCFDTLERIIPRLPHAAEAPLRICRADGPWGTRLFVESVGLGVLAHATAALQHEKLEGTEKRRRGRESLAEALDLLEPVSCAVAVDGVPLEGSFLIVEAMNLPMIGANLRLVPETRLTDDRLTLAYLPEGSRRHMRTWLDGDATGPSPLRHVRGRVVTLEGEAQPLRLEDKTQDWDGTRVELGVEPGRVRVLMPGDVR